MTGANDDDPVDDRLATLERRLRELEDRDALYQLIASYGLAADGMSRAGLEALWAPDGTYETEHHVFEGAAAIGAIVDDPMHLGFVEPGCAHVMSLPISVSQAIMQSLPTIRACTCGTVKAGALPAWLPTDGNWRGTRTDAGR